MVLLSFCEAESERPAQVSSRPALSLLALFLVLFLFILPSSTQSSPTPITPYPEHHYWVDAAYGSDSNNGSLDSPFRTLEHATNRSLHMMYWNIVINLSPGQYILEQVSLNLLTQMVIQKCQECPVEDRAEEEQETIVRFRTPEFGLPSIPTLYLQNTRLALKNLVFEPEPNSIGDVTSFQVAISAQTSELNITGCEWRDFRFVKRINSIITLVYAVGGSSVYMQNVTWRFNELNATGFHIGPSYSAEVAVAFIGHSTDRLLLEDCLAEFNRVISDNVLGGLIAGTSGLTIRRSTFRNNLAFGLRVAWGSIFSIRAPTTVIVEDSKFYNNSATTWSVSFTNVVSDSGGVFNLGPTVNARIINCTFEDNFSVAGGAISVSDVSYMGRGMIEIEGCYFARNGAFAFGAALYISGSKSCSVSIKDSIFDTHYVSKTVDDLTFSSPSIIFVRETFEDTQTGYGLVIHNVTVTHTFKDFIDKRYNKPASRIAAGSMYSASIKHISWKFLVVGSGEGELLLLQDIQVLNVEDLKFWFVGDRAISEDSHKLVQSRSLILIDADSDVSSETSHLTVSNVSTALPFITSSSPLLHIRNTDRVTISAINLNNYRVYPEQGIIFVHSSNAVFLEDINFQSCTGQLVIQDSVTVEMAYSSFRQSKNSLPIVDVSFVSSFLLEKAFFFSSTSTALRASELSKLHIVSSVWQKCTSDGGDGGALFLNAIREVLIDQSSFFSCSAANGGAIYSWQGCKITNSDFFNNSASLSGGAIYTSQQFTQISQSNFYYNIAPSAGAIFAQSTDLIIGTSTFVQNQAISGGGGAIQVGSRGGASSGDIESKPILLINVDFTGNYARERGGAVLVDVPTALKVLLSSFVNNTAGPKEILSIETYSLSEFQNVFGEGGAIYTVGQTSIIKSNFTQNVANIGAAIHTEWKTLGDVSFQILGSSFLSNEAAHTGGALSLNSFELLRYLTTNGLTIPQYLPKADVSDSQFISNTASYYGGVMAFLGLPFNLSCGVNYFRSNVARYGGVFYFASSNNFQDLKTHQFIANEALGGALAYYNLVNTTHEISPSNGICKKHNSCANNTATGWGTFFASGRFYLSWVSLVLNLAPTPPPALIDQQKLIPWPIPGINQTCSEQSSQNPTTMASYWSRDKAQRDNGNLEPFATFLGLTLPTSLYNEEEASPNGFLNASTLFDLLCKQGSKAHTTKTNRGIMMTMPMDTNLTPIELEAEGRRLLEDDDNIIGLSQAPVSSDDLLDFSLVSDDDNDNDGYFSFISSIVDSDDFDVESLIEHERLRIVDSISKASSLSPFSFVVASSGSKAQQQQQQQQHHHHHHHRHHIHPLHPSHSTVVNNIHKRDDDPVISIPWSTYPTTYGPMWVHSGITETVTLVSVDQFGQLVADDRTFPLNLRLISDREDCSSTPSHCNNVTLVNVGNTPVMVNGTISVDVNLVLEAGLDPFEEHYVNLSVTFASISENTPLSWLANLHLTFVIVIHKCPVGSGFAGMDKPYCQLCPFSTFNLNGNGVCQSCSSEPNMRCHDTVLSADGDYWIYKDNITNSASAYLCSSGYCKGKDDSCSPRRTGILCATCQPGYSESIFSSCIECAEPNWGLIFLALILLWVVALVIHTIIAASSGKSTILFYFIQTALLFASDVPISWGKSEDEEPIGLCLFPLNPLSRRVLLSLLPIIMIIQLLVTFAIHRIFVNIIRPLLPPRYQCRTFIEDFSEIYPTNHTNTLDRPSKTSDEAKTPLHLESEYREQDIRRSTGSPLRQQAPTQPRGGAHGLQESSESESTKHAAQPMAIGQKSPPRKTKKGMEKRGEQHEVLTSHNASINGDSVPGEEETGTDYDEDLHPTVSSSSFSGEGGLAKSKHFSPGSSSSSSMDSAGTGSLAPYSIRSDDLLILGDTESSGRPVKGKGVTKNLVLLDGSPHQVISGGFGSESDMTSASEEEFEGEFLAGRVARRQGGSKKRIVLLGDVSSDLDEDGEAYDGVNDYSGSGSPLVLSEEDEQNLPRIVPAFGFELSDEEDEALEEELNEWNVVPENPVEYEGYMRKGRMVGIGNPIGMSTSKDGTALPTLGALRRWMYEKRFFHHYRLIRSLLAMLVFCYSSTSTLVFSLVDCVHIRGGGPFFLKIYPSLICDAKEFRPWLLSLIGLVPFVVCVFISICIMLFRGHRLGLLNQADVRFGIWYEMYKPKFFFWKVVELIRRLTLSAIFVFLNENVLVRGLLLSTSCFIILVAQALAWPYRRKLENSLETISTFILSIISITCIWHSKESQESKHIPATIIWVLIFVTSGIITIAFTVSIFRRRILPALKRLFQRCYRRSPNDEPTIKDANQAKRRL